MVDHLLSVPPWVHSLRDVIYVSVDVSNELVGHYIRMIRLVRHPHHFRRPPCHVSIVMEKSKGVMMKKKTIYIFLQN